VADEAIARAVKDLGALGAAYPDEAAPRFEPPASPTELAELEDAFGGALPADMLALLQTTRAIVAMDIRNGYWIGGPAELSRSIHRRDFPAEVDVRGEAVRAIPLATDGGGNAFMLAVAGSVWRWDHETNGCTFVAENLGTFLHRVAEDWSHDLKGDDTWKYLV
jgi:cell wall assembly regulator SMI1